MKHRILAFVCSIAAALTASAQVPSLINYQGRLTDSNGAPVTGSKNFAISIYDAATGGDLLYEETIGAVTLDSNGVYSFQFGSAGSSNTQVTETIGTTAGSTLTYTKTLTNTPVVNNSITVTDGTNSWSQSVGNPGVGATATANTIVGFVIGATITNGGSGYTSAPAVTITGSGTGATATATISGGMVTGITINSAGSGYTGGATITIAPPVIPFRVDYSGGAITATYSAVPATGRTISATYRYTTSGIASALSAGAEHWMVVSMDGASQGTRQRVLTVPFAQRASFAQSAMTATTAQTAATALTSSTANIATQLQTQTKQWRPEVFTDNASAYSRASSLPVVYIYDTDNITFYSNIPITFKKITNIYIDRQINGHWIQIVRIKAESNEEILATFDSNTTTRTTTNNNLSIVLDPSYIYRIKTSHGYNRGRLNDLVLTVEE
jgi:hypothetical protein